jgi:hypothetical protein
MFQRTRISLVAKNLLAAGAVVLLFAPPAVADDMGGESIEVPPPVADTAPEPEPAPAPAEPAARTSAHWTPIQISLASPVQIFQDPTREVRGLRLNLVYGEWNTVTGLDIGLGNILNGDLRGIQIGFANVVEGSGRGAQIGVFNWSGNEFTGLQAGMLNVIEGTGRAAQIGFANESGTHTGLQIGFANIAGSLRGLQIGVVNVNKSGDPVPFLPVINIGF